VYGGFSLRAYFQPNLEDQTNPTNATNAEELRWAEMKWTQEGAERGREERRHSPDDKPHETPKHISSTSEADQSRCESPNKKTLATTGLVFESTSNFPEKLCYFFLANWQTLGRRQRAEPKSESQAAVIRVGGKKFP